MEIDLQQFLQLHTLLHKAKPCMSQLIEHADIIGLRRSATIGLRRGERRAHHRDKI